MSRQPINVLAPWGVTTENGNYVGINGDGLYADVVHVGKIKFADGSSLESGNEIIAVLPNPIDSGNF